MSGRFRIKDPDSETLPGLDVDCRERSGSYVCEANNRIGRGQSKELLLDVKCRLLLINPLVLGRKSKPVI